MFVSYRCYNINPIIIPVVWSSVYPSLFLFNYQNILHNFLLVILTFVHWDICACLSSSPLLCVSTLRATRDLSLIPFICKTYLGSNDDSDSEKQRNVRKKMVIAADLRIRS